MTPFELFREDCDEVISLINHFLTRGDENPEPKRQPQQPDGFWDF